MPGNQEQRNGAARDLKVGEPCAQCRIYERTTWLRAGTGPATTRTGRCFTYGLRLCLKVAIWLPYGPSGMETGEHDPERAWPGLDPGWIPVFGKDHAPSIA